MSFGSRVGCHWKRLASGTGGPQTWSAHIPSLTFVRDSIKKTRRIPRSVILSLRLRTAVARVILEKWLLAESVACSLLILGAVRHSTHAFVTHFSATCRFGVQNIWAQVKLYAFCGEISSVTGKMVWNLLCNSNLGHWDNFRKSRNFMKPALLLWLQLEDD